MAWAGVQTTIFDALLELAAEAHAEPAATAPEDGRPRCRCAHRGVSSGGWSFAPDTRLWVHPACGLPRHYLAQEIA